MKKVLILAYDYPPYLGVGGFRPYGWYKYLPENDVYPIVVTRQWGTKYGNFLDYVAPGDSDQTLVESTEHGVVLRTPYRPNLSNRLLLKYGKNKYSFIRKLVTAYYEFFQFLFFIGPKVQLYFAAKEYLKKNKVDVIIATGDPFILFKYAAALSKKFNTPWIADYRDPWTFDPKRIRNGIIWRWNLFFEKKYIQTASSVIVVSSLLKNQISSIVNKAVYHVLPNGFNPDTVGNATELEQENECLSIVHAGTVYQWHPLESFLRGCNEFVTNHPGVKLRIDFFGLNIPETLNNLLNTEFVHLKPHVQVYLKIPQAELMRKMARSNVFLVFNSYGFMGTKIYDYLALKRLILLCFSNDAQANELKLKYYNTQMPESADIKTQEDILHETNAGIVVKDYMELARVLAHLYQELTNTGRVHCASENTEQFSRRTQVKLLAEIIKNTPAKNAQPMQAT
jgi:glycosyltransferase involved in cell wall biosynthesis